MEGVTLQGDLLGLAGGRTWREGRRTKDNGQVWGLSRHERWCHILRQGLGRGWFGGALCLKHIRVEMGAGNWTSGERPVRMPHLGGRQREGGIQSRGPRQGRRGKVQGKRVREEGLDGPGSSSFQKLVRELEMQKDKAGQVDGKWEVGLSVEGEREKYARKEGKNRSVRKAALPQDKGSLALRGLGIGRRHSAPGAGRGGRDPGPPTSSCR